MIILVNFERTILQITEHMVYTYNIFEQLIQMQLGVARFKTLTNAFVGWFDPLERGTRTDITRKKLLLGSRIAWILARIGPSCPANELL